MILNEIGPLFGKVDSRHRILAEPEMPVEEEDALIGTLNGHELGLWVFIHIKLAELEGLMSSFLVAKGQSLADKGNEAIASTVRDIRSKYISLFRRLESLETIFWIELRDKYNVQENRAIAVRSEYSLVTYRGPIRSYDLIVQVDRCTDCVLSG